MIYVTNLELILILAYMSETSIYDKLIITFNSSSTRICCEEM